ncbi:hypothetical protein WA026_004606 [Henosepilachna vigintioctopunctata]|uniref:Uncharacterized protein n=1 Tax=Henosepilachna vigintioctopunctata TaxID=420089 RepID=A0AAW1V3V1_9CUCU
MEPLRFWRGHRARELLSIARGGGGGGRGKGVGVCPQRPSDGSRCSTARLSGAAVIIYGKYLPCIYLLTIRIDFGKSDHVRFCSNSLP